MSVKPKKVTNPVGYWKPGQSGNPNGRPKKGQALADNIRHIASLEIDDTLRAELEKEFPTEDFTGMTYMQAVIFRQFRKACLGDLDALEFLSNRTEGKVVEKIDLNDGWGRLQMALNVTAENAPEPVLDNDDADNIDTN